MSENRTAAESEKGMGAQNRDNENLTSAQYEERIESTRQEMDRTLHTLEDRISPRQIWDRISNEWGDEAKQYSRNLGRSLKNNPIPATLLGISLAWLMAAESNYGGRSHHYGSLNTERAKGNLRDKYAEKKSQAADMVSGASDKMHQMSDTMKERRSHLQSKGHEWSDKLQSKGSDIAGQPVILAAAGLVVGSLLAMSLPITAKEQEMLGEKGEELFEKAEEFGREKLKEGQEAAAAAGETFQEELGKKSEQESKPS